ncbi:peptidoglycan recognition family protein [Schleiferilactobacillus harbinensis]|uniref:Peptidoglycan recognition family protein n=1 Tax=Schleiferilactobacillus harbinensis TaxID=304207 RepID=A0ABU7SZH3_9LACO
MALSINKGYVLGANQGDARVALPWYVIMHESGNPKDVYDPNAILNEVKWMRSNWSNAYSTYFVGGGGQIYQIGEPGYVSWAALSANPYAPVQIELARTADRETFRADYQAYIALARQSAQTYGIPLTLDEGSAGNRGIKTHAWVTANYGGDHVDPYAYLASWGISKAQLATDLAGGVSNSSPAADNPNVVTVKYVPGYGVAALGDNGKQVPGSNLVLKHGTAWRSNGISIIGNQACYNIGRGWWLPQQYTDQAGLITINYVPGYGVAAVNSSGKQIAGSNTKFKSGSRWLSATVVKIRGQVCYKVSTSEYIPAQHTRGSGQVFK